MEGRPTCTWDKRKGVLVLRFPVSTAQLSQAYDLVVAPDGGRELYAGPVPAGRHYWIIKAPTDGSFELRIFPATSGMHLNNRREALCINFDANIIYNPESLASAHEYVEIRLYKGKKDQKKQHTRVTKPYRVQIGKTPSSEVQRLRQQLGVDASDEYISAAVTPFRSGVQGPTVDANLFSSETIRAFFHVQCEKEGLPDDAVQLPDFRKLCCPAVELDLTEFGAAAKSMVPGFVFFHRSFDDPDGVLRINKGHSYSLTETQDGRRVLFNVWPDGCHRDLVGVYFSGKHGLHALDNTKAVQELEQEFSDSPLVTAIFLGHRYLPDTQAYLEYEAQLRNLATPVSIEDLGFAHNWPWAAMDERVVETGANLDGVTDASAPTVYSYLEFLGRLSESGTGAQASSSANTIKDVLDDLGLPFNSFASYVKRPDAAWAVHSITKLQNRLRSGFLNRTELETDQSLLAFMVVAVEGDDELPEWLEGLELYEQWAAWRLFLQGQSISKLRIANIRPDQTVESPAALSKALAMVEDEGRCQVALETLLDLGQDPSPLQQPIDRVSSVMSAAKAIERAENSINTEIKVIDGQLETLFLPKTDGAEQARADFGNNFARHNTKEAEPLRQEATEIAKILGEKERLDDMIQSMITTRVSLMALVGTLTACKESNEKAGKLYDWCRRVLQTEDKVWRDTEVEVTPEEQYKIIQLVQGFKRSLQTEMLVLEQAPSMIRLYGLPLWTGDRKLKFEHRREEILAACTNARRWSRSQQTGQIPGSLAVNQRIDGLINEIEQLAEWIAARSLWLQGLKQLEDLVATKSHDEACCKYLMAQRSSPPGQWDSLLEDIERLSVLGA